MSEVIEWKPDQMPKPVEECSDSSLNVKLKVPISNWVFGCGPTVGMMLAGYYDQNGYDNIYTGPVNNGVFPDDNKEWGSTIISNEERALGPLSASMKGLDDRECRGHVDDYWVKNMSKEDHYHNNNWTEHNHYYEQASIADFMGTNQFNKFGNMDGGTRYHIDRHGNRFDYQDHLDWFKEIGAIDIAFGFGEFLKYSGYDNNYFIQATPYFGFDDYKEQIDAGKPVMILVEGHVMLGIGYGDCEEGVIYLHNTWDHTESSMAWDGVYQGMKMFGVIVFELEGWQWNKETSIGQNISEELIGCMDQDACNYNPDATKQVTIFNGKDLCSYKKDYCNNGEKTCTPCDCVEKGIPGCMDTDACNYDSNATLDDGSCIKPVYTCPDRSVICDSSECPPGETDSLAEMVEIGINQETNDTNRPEDYQGWLTVKIMKRNLPTESFKLERYIYKSPDGQYYEDLNGTPYNP